MNSAARPIQHAIRAALYFALFELLIVVGACNSFAQSPAAVSYVLSLASPEQHLVRVQIIMPPGAREHELQLPVWNALYRIRNFSQYINWIRAKDRAGHSLVLRQLDKSRWQLEGCEAGAIIEYQIYSDSPAPFGAQLNAHHAFFNLAEILLYPVDLRNSPVTLRLDLHNDWRIATPLKAGGDTFIAENYDRLVDSPVEAGKFQESDFDDSGAHFRVIVDADPSDYDMPAIVSQLHKIVDAAVSWMDDRPFDSYMFLYHFSSGPGGGGMEHAYSTAIDLAPSAAKKVPDGLASVTAHEFFHLWNVKRIRPQTLEPVDYTKENYTHALWFSEGVTSTAADIIELRANLIDEELYLRRLGAEITELERRPAHLTQSVEDSSLDAWLEGDAYYRRPDRSISYYNKGELLGVMLDLAVREASHGGASLREVLQWMNTNYAKRGRYFNDSEGVREAAEAVSHADLGWFFTKYVSGTEEIPWDDFFRSVGLRVEGQTITIPDPGFVASRNFDAPMSVATVTPGSGAEHAGLQVGDTVLELQGKPVGQESRSEMYRLQPGDSISVKVRASSGGVRELKWKVGSAQELSYDIKDLDQVTPEQRARRSAWLKGEAEKRDEKSSSGAAKTQ